MITDRHPEWPAMKRDLLKDVEAWRIELERPDLPPGRDQFLRGLIAGHRGLINTIEPGERPEISSPDYAS